MNRRICMYMLLGSVLAFTPRVARGQQGPPPLPPEATAHGGPGGEWMGPPMGERMELLGFEGMHGGKVVTGAPFSAVAVSETTQTLLDGNQITRKTQTNLFRDSQGRLRKEVTLSGFAGQPKSFVVVNDPVGSKSFVLHPDTKTAEIMPGHGMKGLRKGAANGAVEGKFAAREQQLMAEGNLKMVDLGSQTIAGVSAQCTQITRTIPAQQMGNVSPINIVSERCYSNDLQMVVMSTRSDPRFGTTTYTLSNIQPTEPAASLFTMPLGYAVKRGGPGRHGMMKFKQGPPPDN
jgi:hypothetical protein